VTLVGMFNVSVGLPDATDYPSARVKMCIDQPTGTVYYDVEPFVQLLLSMVKDVDEPLHLK